MILSLVLMVAVTVLATYWARQLAFRRGRHIGGWAFATALFPPLVLILWLLPGRAILSKA